MKKRAISSIILALLLTCVLGIAACGEDVTPGDVTYTITFNLNEGKGNIRDQEVKENEDFRRPSTNPTREGYVFLDWYTELTGGTAIVWPVKATGDMTVYARWRVAEQFTVTLVLNDGELPSGATNPIIAYESTNVSLPVPEKTGQLFDGWVKNLEDPTSVVASIANISENHTLYARWKDIPAALEGWLISGIANGFGYTMASDMPQGLLVVDAVEGDATPNPFNFTVTRLGGIAGTPTVSYTMSGQGNMPDLLPTAESLTGLAEEGEHVFRFTIPAVTGHVFISGVTGFTRHANAVSIVNGIASTMNYKMTGASAVMNGSDDYIFTVAPRFSFTGTPTVTYRFDDGDDIVLESTDATVAGGVYTFKITRASIVAAGAENIYIDPVDGISDETVTSYDMGNGAGDFFNPESWVASTNEGIVGEGGLTAPVVNADGGLEFSGSNHGFNIGGDSEEIHLSFIAKLPSSPTKAFGFHFFVDVDQDTKYYSPETRDTDGNSLTLGNPGPVGGTWGGLLFHSSESHHWISAGIEGFNNTGGVGNLDNYNQFDIIIVTVGSQRIYRLYHNGEKLNLVLDGGGDNASTQAPRNLNITGGNLIEYLDPAEFSDGALRRKALFTAGDYLFIEAGENPVILYPFGAQLPEGELPEEPEAE